MDLSHDRTLLHVYRISDENLSEEIIFSLANQIQTSKKLAKYITQAWKSDRYPYTIMRIGAKIGIFFPYNVRFGTSTYLFFLNNLAYYEEAILYPKPNPPTIQQIALSHDPVKLLMGYRDDQILKRSLVRSSGYLDRRDMLNDLVTVNYLGFGFFRLISNSRLCYDLNTRSIVYTEPSQKILYSVHDLLQLTDVDTKQVRKNSRTYFKAIVVYQLHCQIYQKFSMWKDRNGHLEAPESLVNLLFKLNKIHRMEKG